MSNELFILLMIVGMGAGSFFLRVSCIALFSRREIPPRLLQALDFVPPAALCALIVPALLLRQGEVVLPPDNMRLVAGTIAALVAWRTQNVILTLVTGMGLLWMLQWLVR